MKILCFGDSNTYGYDPRSFFGSRYPAEVRWTDLLARETGCEVINSGMNGRSIPAGGFVSLPHADLLIVMLGSNDLLNGCSAEETAFRMEGFLTQLRSAYHRILLVAPPPMYPGQWVTEERLMVSSAQLGPVYEEISTRLGIPFADAAAWNIEMAYDGVHFSESGNQAFASALARCLQQFSFPELG